MALKNNSGEGKGSLLDRWLSLNKEQEVKTGISPRPVGVQAPLSSGQQKLWFLQQLYPGNPFYNYAEAYRFKGNVNMEHLIKGFRMVASRHDMLRTTFSITGGKAIQAVDSANDVEVKHIDWPDDLPAEEKELQAFIAREADRPFDLNQGPLTRICLVKMTDDEYLAIVSMHHIITDEWSLGILREEWASNYQALQAGDATSPAPLPVQYADYAYWQQSNEPDPSHLAYWKEKLQGNLPVINLPTDRSRPAIPSFKGEFCRRWLPQDLSEQIISLTGKTNTTLFVFLLAAFKVLLHRLSGQQDILVGTPFNGRDHISLEKLIGYFIDTLVLRSALKPDSGFTDVLAAVRQTSLEAFSHKNLPFETLVKTLKPGRFMSVNPLFQVMFVYHKAPALPSFGTELVFEQVDFASGSSKFDLTLHMSEENGRLSATFEYATDLFGRTTIERIQDHFRVLLEGIVENPETPIARLPLLTKAGRHQLLTTWNQTATPMANNLPVHALFEQQAAKRPEAPALAFKEVGMSYRQLDEKAGAIAALILAKGGRPNTVVGLYTERSPEMIVGILGILKAGCAYLPLDPEYPEERIHFMAQDAGTSLILTPERLSKTFSDKDIPLITFEEAAASISRPVRSINVSGEDPAYVIYTSGSTGRPKGVAISHDNLRHATLARIAWYKEAPECFLLLSSFAFDSSVAGIFWTLCTGGQLILPEKRIEQDINRLADIIATHRITHTLMLPSLYALLLQHAPAKSLDSLHTVIVAGESCMPSLCALHEDTLGGTALYNEYGPTEATVWCTVHKIRKEDAMGPVPIGRPIQNTRIYILDETLEPVPAGVPGALYVAGAGLAGGYINQPGLSAQKFIPDPFADNPETKMYKTGDMARFRHDGTIEFLGRADEQVKIRGFRIELSEIAETLKQLPGVQDAVVLLQKAPTGPFKGDANPADTAQLLSALDELETHEALELLTAVEQLSETALEVMLNKMMK